MMGAFDRTAGQGGAGKIDVKRQSLIDIDKLSRTYVTAAGEQVEALADIDLAIGDGEFVSVVGPSGCGKSTLLRLIAALDRPDGGTISVDGAPVTGPSPSVGVVFQSANLLPWYTVLGNVQLPMRVGRHRKAEPDAAHALLKMAGLDGFENKYPYELSGGMQQRAAICRALIRDPKVLLMDEPFGALDALTRERMNAELQRIWLANSKTVLLITHSISEAVFLGDRVVVMSARPGRIIADLPVNLERPRTFEKTVNDPEFLRLSQEVRSLLHFEEEA